MIHGTIPMAMFKKKKKALSIQKDLNQAFKTKVKLDVLSYVTQNF